MKVLVIGSGGREHALAWKAARSNLVDEVLVAPGNAGTASEKEIENVAIAADNISALLEFANDKNIDLTIVGPEAPLVDGIVDQFTASGRPCFGPLANAAQLEGSKAFTKAFLSRHQIPTAAYETFENVEKACDYIKKIGTPVVVKADGLAAGKGVIVAQTEQQAFDAVTDMLAGNRFGEAGHRVVIEEFLSGEEASFICIVDGQTVLPLASSQDHKARDDGDIGPNTGGMGAYSPAPVVDEVMHERIMQQVMLPTVKGLKADGIHYTGFLYAGLMIDNNGVPKVIEFNCRFGDPEAQPIMMRLKSDLVELCLAAVNGNLKDKQADWDERAALGVVMAADGYPESYQKGRVIEGLKDNFAANTKVFQAGTDTNGNQIVTSGGRVLCVTALGDSVADAQKNAYKAVRTITFDGAFYRKDIGYRAVARESV